MGPNYPYAGGQLNQGQSGLQQVDKSVGEWKNGGEISPHLRGFVRLFRQAISSIMREEDSSGYFAKLFRPVWEKRFRQDISDVWTLRIARHCSLY